MKRTALINGSGIYQIQSTINGKRYVGSSISVKSRILGLHLSQLRKGTHGNILLQRHVDKYGLKVLQFSILEICNKDKLIEREQYWIDLLNPEFNICKKAYSQLGVKRSEMTKRRISRNHADFSGKNNPCYGKKKSRHIKLKLYKKTFIEGHNLDKTQIQIYKSIVELYYKKGKIYRSYESFRRRFNKGKLFFDGFFYKKVVELVSYIGCEG